MDAVLRVRLVSVPFIEKGITETYDQGMFGYSHLTGGFAGGQAEWVRVPYGDVNLLALPDDVPDEKGLFLSDVLATSWHAVTDTGVARDDIVAIWGAGPIGQMVAEFSFLHGASRVILIDGGPAAWRLDFVKKHAPKLETIDFSRLPKGESVSSQLKKMCNSRGPDVAIECAAGEYAQSWQHYFETLLGMETDTSELLNEMITSVRAFGRCGITGIYAGYVSAHNFLIFFKFYPNPIETKSTDHLSLGQSFEHRIFDADRDSLDRQWPSACPQVLGSPFGADPGEEN